MRHWVFIGLHNIALVLAISLVGCTKTERIYVESPKMPSTSTTTTTTTSITFPPTTARAPLTYHLTSAASIRLAVQQAAQALLERALDPREADAFVAHFHEIERTQQANEHASRTSYAPNLGAEASAWVENRYAAEMATLARQKEYARQREQMEKVLRDMDEMITSTTTTTHCHEWWC